MNQTTLSLLTLLLSLTSIESRKYEIHPACYSGDTRMPQWAKDNINRCVPIYETNATHDSTIHSSVAGGEWKFFHFAMNSFDTVNQEGGTKIRVSASPCHGSIELYVKPGLNFNGEPMNQMFETTPLTNGLRTDTWPFPNNYTGVVPQGPERHMMEPGWEYPGPMFKEMLWGFNAVEFGKENVISAKVLHGSFFISVYGKEMRDDPNIFKDQLDNNFTLSVSFEPNLAQEEVTKQKDKDTARQTSMKTDKIEGAHGEYLLVQWDAPDTPRLVNPPGDRSIQHDLNSYDEYQVYWATDSQTFFDFEQPNEEGWGFKLIENGAIRHPFLEQAPGFCYWPGPNTTNTSTRKFDNSGNLIGGIMSSSNSPAPANVGLSPAPAGTFFDPNATVPGPVNTDCIMDTECGIRNNGVPAYVKVKRNWATEVKGLALFREICTAVRDEASGEEMEECVRNPSELSEVRKPDPKAKEFVRYQMHVNRHGEGVTEGVECGRTEYTFAGEGFYNRSNGVKCTKGMPTRKVSVNGHVNDDYCDKGILKTGVRCKPGLQCQYKLMDDKYRCEKTYLRPDTANPMSSEIFIRTRVPHDCWKTGDEYCKKGTKIINVPPVERRVKLEITNNKFTERWQPWNPKWVQKYMDTPDFYKCKSAVVGYDRRRTTGMRSDVNEGRQLSHGVTYGVHDNDPNVGNKMLSCIWNVLPGEVVTDEYELNYQKHFKNWKKVCADICTVDMSFENAPLRFRVPEIEMVYDGSQSTRFGLDGIIHASETEVNGAPTDASMKNRVKLYGSLEEAFTAVFTAHGIASAVDAVSDSDVLVLQSRCDIEVTTPTDSVSAESALYTIPMGPMPCSEPFWCTFMHWRSREVKVNVMRRKCIQIMKDPKLGYKCSQFTQLRELYSGTKGNTTYDQESQGASDTTIRDIGIGVAVVLAFLVSIIAFMKVRTSMRLNKAYEHVDKHLAGQPAAIDQRRSDAHLLDRAKTEKSQAKQAELWDKKSKMIKNNIQKKKDEFKRRMKAIKKENQRREKDIKHKIQFEASENAKVEQRRAKIREQRAEIARNKAKAEYDALIAKRHAEDNEN